MPTSRRDLEAARAGRVGALHRVHPEHDALRAERLRAVRDDLRVLDRERVDRDLLGAREDDALHVGDRAQPPADRERDADRPRDRPDHADVDRTMLGRRRDVVEDELVRAAVGVADRHLDGIAEVDVVLELHALRDASVAHVEARYDSLGQHGEV